MKTLMQELIEVLKIHRDMAYAKVKVHPTHAEYYDVRGQAFEDAISFADEQLKEEKEVKPKYFERNQARIVFYAIQMAIDSGAKYIYMTDAEEIIAFKEPMKPREIELTKSELVLTL